MTQAGGGATRRGGPRAERPPAGPRRGAGGQGPRGGVRDAGRRRLAALGAGLLLVLVASPAPADEGGVSFWLPGQFGSLAAVPLEPGWALPVLYYHTSSDVRGGRSFPIGGRIAAGLDARADLMFLMPTYVLATPVLGGQAALSMAWAAGNVDVSADATLTGPRGNVLTLNPSDSVWGGSDLYPSVSLRWQDGHHHFLAYGMGGVPVGAYETGRLANIGTNHWSVDAGGGYTYFNRQTGRELSLVVGATYNFENPDTHYQNGIDAHLDWGASQFLSERWHVGLVGYVYHQVTGDSGAGARLGDFKSRVVGIGPQVGHFFELWDRRWYLNVKGYYEFAASHRTDGWNVWLTLVIPLGAGKR